MKRPGLWGWASLTGLGLTLAVMAGCASDSDDTSDGEGDDGSRQEGTDPRNIGPAPGPTAPGGTGTPVVRKMGLSLAGVAGFAILEQQGTTEQTGSALSIGSRAASGDALWLESSSLGQVLVRSAPLQQSLEGIDAPPVPRLPGDIAQAPDDSTSPPTSDPGAGTVEDGVAPTSDDPAEQAGLLKITEDGSAEPALVLIDQTPVEGTEGEQAPAAGENVGSADAGAPPSTSEPDRFGPGPAPSPSGAPNAGPVPGGSAPPPHYEPLPRVTAVGLSPDGSVYILFEHAFLYRQPEPEDFANGFDPRALDSGYRCQLFRAAGDWRDGSTASGASLAELECVTNQYEVRTWDARRVMQFDASGKLYFRASLPGQPNEIFYQYDPETGALQEKVNANICWRDVRVTPRGSLFYTGQSGTDGNCMGGGGGSFFRYVSADNQLTEIARDWWDFKYLSEQDPEDPENERIIFYGPDPSATSGTDAWQSACLYRYNPAVSDPAERTQRLVECIGDPWNYTTGSCMGPSPTPESAATCVERCTSEGQLFVGGQGVNEISQLGDGTLFVVGTFQRKLAGQINCSLAVSVDHCAESADWGPGVEVFPQYESEQACSEAGHVWLWKDSGCVGAEGNDPGTCDFNGGDWHNGFGGTRIYDQVTGDNCSIDREGYATQYINCMPAGGNQPGPGGGFVQEVNGLAYLLPRADSSLSDITLLSDPNEEVERYWAIAGSGGSEIFYSVYSGGNYSLRSAVQTQGGIERRVILDGYEVYNLQRDPATPNRVLFDALQFASNSYVFGSINPTLPTPAEVAASLELVNGVSGRVETLVVLPNF